MHVGAGPHHDIVVAGMLRYLVHRDGAAIGDIAIGDRLVVDDQHAHGRAQAVGANQNLRLIARTVGAKRLR